MKLTQWVQKIQSLSAVDMDLSLERVHEVASRLDLLGPKLPVITVAGTNGKGSCVAGLEAVYGEAGYKTGAFTSPQIWRINELFRINGKESEDGPLCRAYEKIASACDDVSLTLFEFNTLAAFILFKEADLAVWILEVGLGGRFDAVNVLDADLAVIASIDLDHMEWLGDTREKIALEKAGVFRPHKPAVCGDFNPPHTLMEYAHQNEVTLFCQNRHFSFKEKDNYWDWNCGSKTLTELPLTSLALQNMSSVLMAIELMQDRLPVDENAIRRGMQRVKLPGRIQVIPGEITTVLDVSHNPASVGMLANWLKQNPTQGQTYAVFSMLGDKDILSTLNVIKDQIAGWFTAELEGKRAASIELIMEHFKKAEIKSVMKFCSLKEAHQAAKQICKIGDRLVVFGSFHTIECVVS